MSVQFPPLPLYQPADRPWQPAVYRQPRPAILVSTQMTNSMASSLEYRSTVAEFCDSVDLTAPSLNRVRKTLIEGCRHRPARPSKDLNAFGAALSRGELGVLVHARSRKILI